MGSTMDTTANLTHRIDIQCNNLPTGIQFGKNSSSPFIGFTIPELGSYHRAVTNVVIDIGRHEIVAFERIL